MDGWMVGKLHYTLLPNLLDVKIELELLFKTVPGESDLVPIRRKAGPDFKPGKGCEWDDGQRFGLFLQSRSQQVTAQPGQ